MSLLGTSGTFQSIKKTWSLTSKSLPSVKLCNGLTDVAMLLNIWGHYEWDVANKKCLDMDTLPHCPVNLNKAHLSKRQIKADPEQVSVLKK